jgi:hypothetical protein
MSTELILFGMWAILSVLIGIWAMDYGRNWGTWLVISLLLSPLIGGIALMIVGKKRPAR